MIMNNGQGLISRATETIFCHCLQVEYSNYSTLGE